MCPRAMSGGVRGARWTQIDAIARANVPCRPLEWRLPCQMNCRKAWNRALTAVRGRLGFFLQVIARADVTRSYARRGLQRSMDTNRCHRASRCALQAPRMAIAVPDDTCRNRGQRTITICGNGEHRCTGGLAPIIEIRISGPPGSGSLRRDGVGTCSDETKPNLHLAPQKLCPQNRGYSWTKWHFERFCPRNRPFSWTKSSQPESVI